LASLPSRHLLREGPPKGAEPAREVITSNTEKCGKQKHLDKTNIKQVVQRNQNKIKKKQDLRKFESESFNSTGN
jgi:hypothetical protein